MQDGWVVEIRKRLEGKAAGQQYKVWISPKGTQTWTRCLGLAMSSVLNYIVPSMYIHVSIYRSGTGTAVLISACFSFTWILERFWWNLRGAAAAEGFTEKSFEKLAEIQKNLKPVRQGASKKTPMAKTKKSPKVKSKAKSRSKADRKSD